MEETNDEKELAELERKRLEIKNRIQEKKEAQNTFSPSDDTITKKQTAIEILRVISTVKREFGITIILVLVGAVLQLLLGLIGIVVSAPVVGGWIMWRMAALNKYGNYLAQTYGLAPISPQQKPRF